MRPSLRRVTPRALFAYVRRRRWIRRAFERVPLDTLLRELSVPDQPRELGRVLAALRVGEALFRRVPFDPDTCLYRALARYGSLRGAGHPAKFLMGIDPGDPERGHAWVELDGRPLWEKQPSDLTVTFTYPDKAQ